MTKSILSPKFQIVIPKEIRKHLNLKPGQQVELIENAGHIEVHPVLAARDLIGLLQGSPVDFERELDRIVGG